MKRLFLQKHVFLLFSLFFFTLSFLVWYFFDYRSPKTHDQRSVQTITEKVNEQLKDLTEESFEVREVIRTSEIPSFSRLDLPLKFPYFVFRNKGLYFWSDNSFLPPYPSLNGAYQFRFLQLRNGKYIVHKESISKRGDLFEIFSFLPLSSEYSIQNHYVNSGLNERIFNSFPFVINPLKDPKGNNVYSYRNEFLFGLEIPKNQDYRNESLMLLLVLFIALSVWFLFLYLYEWVQYLSRSNRPGYAIVLFGLGLAATRGVMLAFHYPFSLYESDLFNSKYFASSSVSPSLGDVLMNTIALLAFAALVYEHYYKTRLFKMLIKARGMWRTITSVVCSFLSFYGLYLVAYMVEILSYHSQWSLDVTADIDFNVFRVMSLLMYIGIFGIYFISSHILFRIFIALNDGNTGRLVLLFITGGLLWGLLSVTLQEASWILFFINLFYFLILYYLRFPESVGKIRYSTYLYYLTSAFVCSITGAYSIFEEHVSRSVFNKQHYANGLLFKNDVFGEYLLHEASGKLKQDKFIQTRFITPLSAKGILEHKIQKVFLSNYFDKYDVLVSVFDQNGEGYEKSSDYSNYAEAEQKYRQSKYQTDYPDIYFIADPETGSRKYINFNEIRIDSSIVGYVVIELKHKKVVPHSIYPELLESNASERPAEGGNYNYAVYARNKLIYSLGNFNYASQFDVHDLQREDLYKRGIIHNGFHHIGIKGGEGKVIVISSETYSFKRIFSNFSFFFLLLILFILLFLVGYALNNKKVYRTTTYATKIQIFLNIAFFLPLLIVSITTLSIIGISYQDSINNAFIKKGEDISASIGVYLQDKRLNQTQRERLENVLEQIGKYTESDIVLFNNRGRLIFSNQPMIYDLGFLSRLIHPMAYAALVENNQSSILLQEKIGSIRYNGVYIAIRSAENNTLLGILSMPFFESKNELDQQIIYVLTTIVNIFVTIFILFLILSYFASHVLTVPLKIITQRLKKTTLGKNEPIEWKTKDEIGMLVEEYNSMLVKLEESRDALSRSEKESAWREMAKQVAHEIKNPLTPMKLTIQHLQRSVQSGDSDLPDKTKKALNVLLDQVDNLNEIATSFSLFAKMPIPKNQRFNISDVLAKTVALHNNSADTVVESSIEAGDFYVMGDEQLMSGIFTNLILNGIQSVPSSRSPEISVTLSRQNSNVLIMVRDNGSGIPAQIGDKVFLPNFSTKFAGSGIGLAVAKRGVEHAGGRIWFDTREGAGTAFYIEIPLTD